MTIMDRAIKEATAGNVPRDAVVEARNALAEKCLELESGIERHGISNPGLIKRHGQRVKKMKEQVGLLDQWLKETE